MRRHSELWRVGGARQPCCSAVVSATLPQILRKMPTEQPTIDEEVPTKTVRRVRVARPLTATYVRILDRRQPRSPRLSKRCGWGALPLHTSSVTFVEPRPGTLAYPGSSLARGGQRSLPTTPGGVPGRRTSHGAVGTECSVHGVDNLVITLPVPVIAP